ncbi:MAG TPA: hypothetical protein VLM40_14775, partial [Gemmata sp.]|nr:hypothetical protein [Gemmata sp.]
LAVPDGTTALVRCPACKSVFAPADGLAPEPEPVEEKPRKKPERRPRDDDEDEDDRPRKRNPAAKSRENSRDENREFDPIDPEEERRRKKKRRRHQFDDLSPEERAALMQAFERAAWGARLIWISFVLFIISMMIVDLFWFMGAFPSLGSDPAYMIAAGVIGGIGWVLGAIGLGLCLSGPASPGHWGYGISAAVFTTIHLILMMALASKGQEYSGGLLVDPGGPAAHWGLVPTRLDAVTYYLTLLVYKDQDFLPKGDLNFSIVVGIFEILRTTLILMLLSCLAESAGDKDLSHRCTRAAGFTSFGPGFLALGMLVLAMLLIESHAGINDFTKVIFTTAVMGTYTVIAGCMFPGFMATRDVDDACGLPFQSQIPKL